MHSPVLRERITLPHLAAAPTPIRPVVTLHKAGVHTPAHRRQRQGPRHRLRRPEHHTRTHPHHTVGLSLLVHRRVGHIRRDGRVRLAGTAPTTGSRWCHSNPVGLPNDIRVHRVFVGGHQPHYPATGPPPEVPDQRPRRLGRPFPDHQADD